MTRPTNHYDERDLVPRDLAAPTPRPYRAPALRPRAPWHLHKLLDRQGRIQCHGSRAELTGYRALSFAYQPIRFKPPS